MPTDILARGLAAKALQQSTIGPSTAISTISRNGVTLPIVGGNVNVQVPEFTSQLNNDADFQSGIQVDAKITALNINQYATVLVVNQIEANLTTLISNNKNDIIALQTDLGQVLTDVGNLKTTVIQQGLDIEDLRARVLAIETLLTQSGFDLFLVPK